MLLPVTRLCCAVARRGARSGRARLELLAPPFASRQKVEDASCFKAKGGKTTPNKKKITTLCCKPKGRKTSYQHKPPTKKIFRRVTPCNPPFTNPPPVQPVPLSQSS